MKVAQLHPRRCRKDASVFEIHQVKNDDALGTDPRSSQAADLPSKLKRTLLAREGVPNAAAGGRVFS